MSAFKTQVSGNHYSKLVIQPMQYSMANKLDACQHTIIKYVTRFRDKNGRVDLEKAKHVLDMLIELEYGNNSETIDKPNKPIDADGWIVWEGGGRPVDFDLRVEAQNRNGEKGTNYAGAFFWEHTGTSGDIVAYRIIKDGKDNAPTGSPDKPKPAKEWVYEPLSEDGSIAGYKQVDKTSPDDVGPWETWEGGDRPISGDTLVEVALRSGSKTQNVAGLSWIHWGRPTDVMAYRLLPAKTAQEAKTDEGEGWEYFDGGRCPVEPDTVVEVVLMDETQTTGPAKSFSWEYPRGDFGVTCYRVVKPQPKATDAEGWIQWGGGARPVGPGTLVEVVRKNGARPKGEAYTFFWGRCSEAREGLDIVRYRVIPENPA